MKEHLPKPRKGQTPERLAQPTKLLSKSICQSGEKKKNFENKLLLSELHKTKVQSWSKLGIQINTHHFMLGPWGERAEGSPRAFNGLTSGYTALRLLTGSHQNWVQGITRFALGPRWLQTGSEYLNIFSAFSVYTRVCVLTHSVMSDSLQPHGL